MLVQNDFYTAIFQKNMSLSFISSNDPQERFNIYRQTIILNLINALSITFPAIWQLLGKTCADSVAAAFCSSISNLPESGCLDDWGAQFPEFLASLDQLKHLPYLKDYALYEWNKHQAYIAKDAEPITTDELSSISEDKMSSIKFFLLPSLFSFSSNFPLYEIQEILENPKANSIKLSNKSAFALIYRNQEQIITLWITEELWHFFSSLQHGLNLEEALEKVPADFNLTQAIHFLLEKQLIHKVII